MTSTVHMPRRISRTPRFEYWDDAAADVLRRLAPVKAACFTDISTPLENTVVAVGRAIDYAHDSFNSSDSELDSLAGLESAASLAMYSLGLEMDPTFGIPSELSAIKNRVALHALLVDRQAKYGPTNITRFGLLGILIRVTDKAERLKNLISTGVVTSDESVVDTLSDVIGYYVVATMFCRGDFGLPLKTQPQPKEAK